MIECSIDPSCTVHKLEGDFRASVCVCVDVINSLLQYTIQRVEVLEQKLMEKEVKWL